MSDEPLLAEVLNFGQGDDDCVFDAFKGIYYLQKGYYTLINYGDEWWEDTLNQDVWCNKLIEEQWHKIDWEQFETTIEMIFKVMCGSYVNEYKFFEALEKLNELGDGYRPQRKSEQLKEQKE